MDKDADMLGHREIVALLELNPFLREAPEEIRKQLAERARVISFERGEFIYAKNDSTEDFYILIDGRVGHPEVQIK